MPRPALVALAMLVVTPLVAQPEEAANLAPNPGFELGEGGKPEGWGFYSWRAAEGRWDDTHARTGSRSLGLKGENGGWYTTFPVSAGLLYHLRFRYRAEGARTNVVLFVREVVSGQVTETILYKPEQTYLADQRGSFVAGVYVGGADEQGWVLFEGGEFAPREGVDTLDVLIKIQGDDPDAQVWLDDLVITARQPAVIGPTDRLLAELPGVVVWTDDVNRKIMPDQQPRPIPADLSLTVRAAAGEYECFQIALTPSEALRQVDWEWSAFSGPGALPPGTLTCRLVECIPITRARSAVGQTGPQPDALTARLPADLPANVTQSFWFTARVPPTQPAGEYRTDLRLRINGQEAASFPLALTVRGFSVPAWPSLDTYSSFRYYLVTEREPGDPQEVIERYYRSFFTHRTSCPPAAPVPVTVQGDEAQADLTEYIRHLRHLRDAYGLDRTDVPSLWLDHAGTHRMPRDVTWQGRPIFADDALTQLDPAFERPFRAYFGQVCRTLREVGLFERPRVYFFDEPDLEDAATRNGLRALSKLILDIDPEVTVSIAASDPHPELIDVIRLWVIHTDAWYRFLPHIEAARQAGCEVHVYNNAVNSPDQRRLRVRLWPWLLWKYRVDGTFSWWGTVCWRGDMADPWTVGQGDFSGVLIYPPRSAAEHGPIESVRWELYREGLEDYEYLALAEHLADEMEAAGRPAAAEPLRSALAQAMALVTRWPDVRTAADEPYTLDPAEVAAAREALASAIEAALRPRA